MKTIHALSIPLLATLLIQTAHAEISASSANRFITTYYQAIQRHDIATVSAMLDDRVTIKVIWTQSDTPQTFTLNKADYLQQLKATWHFAVDDHYEIKNQIVTSTDGITIVSLTDTETRTLFGNKAGQQNDLKMSLGGDNSAPHIVAISNKTTLW